MPVGTYQICATGTDAAGFDLHQVDGPCATVKVTAGGNNDFTVELSRQRVNGVTVSVANQTGDLSALASVSAVVENADGVVLPDLTITDNTGAISDGAASFTIDSVPVGDYILCVTGKDAAGYDLTQVPGPCATVEVTDTGSNDIAIQVSRDRVPSASISVKDQTNDLSAFSSVSVTIKNAAGDELPDLSVTNNTDDIDGDTATFSFTGVPVGVYQVCATGQDAAGFAVSPSSGNECEAFTVTVGGDNDFLVKVSRQRVGSASIAVKDQTNDLSAFSSVSVTLKNADGVVLPDLTVTDDSSSIVDGVATFPFEGVPVGTYQICATGTDAAGFDLHQVDGPCATVEVTSAGNNDFAVDVSRERVDGVTVTATDVDQAISSFASVSATVHNADGVVLPNLTITDNTDAISGDTASFAIDGVPIGSYQLCLTGKDVSGAPLVPVSGDECLAVQVTSSGANAFQVNLQQQSGAVAGYVTDKDGGAGIAGAAVTVLAADGSTAGSATTAADGSYSIELQPGTYTVCFAADGYVSQCQQRGAHNVAVSGGVSTTVSVALPAVTVTDVVSTPSNLSGWFGDTPDTATPSYVINDGYAPAAGHSGVGSASMDLTVQPASSWWRSVTAPLGVRLDAVSQIGFSESVTGSSGLSYELVVCNSTSGDNSNSDCLGYTRLVWTPPAPGSADWTTVTADLATATWWTTRSLTNQPKGTALTLAQIFANNPTATVVAYGIFRGTTGGATTSDPALVDDVVFNGTSTDFDPDSASISLTATNLDESLAAATSMSMTVKTTSGTTIGAWSMTADSDDIVDGSATVTGSLIPTGDYLVCVTGRAGSIDLVPADGTDCQPVTVSLNGPNAFTVDLHQAPGTVELSATDLDQALSPFATVTLQVWNADKTTSLYEGTGSTTDGTIVGDTASVTAPNIPVGSYLVCIIGTDAGGNSLVPADGQECSAVEVTSGDTVSAHVDLVQAPGSISGTVTAVDGGDPVENVGVTVYASGNGAAVGSAISGADGGYTVDGLPAGDYLLCFDANDAGGYVSTCGATVSVTSGQTATVDQALATARAEATCDPTQFVDVPSGQFCADITWLAGSGITSGTDATHYTPAGNVSRGQMAMFLYRMAHDGQNAPACTVRPFVDVPVGANACGAITWLVGSSITSGTDATHYTPAGTVSRGQMAMFLYRMLHHGDHAPSCSDQPFVDVPVSAPACGAIAWLASTGITSGTDATHFEPGKAVTRAQMAAFLHRLVDLTSIRGTVESESGPVKGVSVVTTGVDGTSASYSTVTDENGGYAVTNIQPGTYRVCFDGSSASGAPAAGYAFQCYDDVVGGGTPDTVTVAQWSPSTVDAELAAPVS